MTIGSASPQIAVLIDVENVSAKMADTIFREAESFGSVVVRRAYANWASPCNASWIKKISQFAINPVQQFSLVKGKNCSDIALVVDAMTILGSKDIDCFILVSSDSDFSPLIVKLREEGKHVIVFGSEITNNVYRAIPNDFLILSELMNSHEASDATERLVAALEVKESTSAQIFAPEKPEQVRVKQWSAEELKCNSFLISNLRRIITERMKEDGWAALSEVCTVMKQEHNISYKAFGYASMTTFVNAMDLFECNTKGSEKFIRNRRLQMPTLVAS